MSPPWTAAIPAWAAGQGDRRVGHLHRQQRRRDRGLRRRWAMASGSRPPLRKPPSTSSSAGALPRSSRCSGQRKALIGSCRPEPALLTARSRPVHRAGIRLCPPTTPRPPRRGRRRMTTPGFCMHSVKSRPLLIVRGLCPSGRPQPAPCPSSGKRRIHPPAGTCWSIPESRSFVSKPGCQPSWLSRRTALCGRRL